jgi:hypothetical protein
MTLTSSKVRKTMANHHPDRENFPEWVLDVGNQYFHKTTTIVQRMLPTPENVTIIHNLIMALEYEYLIKRCILDVEEGIAKDAPAVKKAIKEAIERRKADLGAEHQESD